MSVKQLGKYVIVSAGFIPQKLYWDFNYRQFMIDKNSIIFGRKGLTLVELLVVISVMAILISILVPALQKARESAQEALCINNIRQLTFSALEYGMDNEDLVPPSPGPGYSGFTYALLYPEYLDSTVYLLCPAWNRNTTVYSRDFIPLSEFSIWTTLKPKTPYPKGGFPHHYLLRIYGEKSEAPNEPRVYRNLDSDSVLTWETIWRGDHRGDTPGPWIDYYAGEISHEQVYDSGYAHAVGHVAGDVAFVRATPNTHPDDWNGWMF